MEAGLKIVMLGARRCGKSSTLASMLTSLDSLDSGIAIQYSDEATKTNLKKKQSEMRQIFSSDNIERGLWIDQGESGDSSVSVYSLDVIIHEKLTFHTSCVDIPGEIVQNDMGTLVNILTDSDVIIVAIDTPQLMENNYSGRLANYVDAFHDLCKILVTEKHLKGKRIILVPLKCERYLHDNRMDKVADKVKEVYSDFIKLWKENGKSECFIIPVQTLGDLEFDHFDHIKKVGYIAYYRYCGNKNYSPRNCEQPLVYAIDYAVNALSWSAESKWYAKATKKVVDALYSVFN